MTTGHRLRGAAVGAIAVVGFTGLFGGPAGADRTQGKGPLAFNPITGSADAPYQCSDQPFVIPEGYTQRIVSDESDLNIYPGMPDWPDMNTVNETGRQAGRYLYRTHEVRPQTGAAYRGGSVSVVDLKSGEAEVLVQRQDWEALDGLVWSPWGTLLFAEEVGPALLPDPDHPQARNGLLYELFLDPKDPTKAAEVVARPLLGSMAHEGIEFDAQGNVYVIDEFASGSIYKFVPNTRGDLSSGQLYALKVTDESADRTGAAQWVPLNMEAAAIDARAEADRVGATGYGRPEDLERIGNTLYAAITSEDRVISISLSGQPVVQDFVRAGKNLPVEVDPDNSTDPEDEVDGFNSPDNLADGPGGTLWIVEDNTPSDIFVAQPDRNGDGLADEVSLFASLDVPGAEATGIYFGKDPKTLYINVQHAACPGNPDGDMTVAISPEKGSKGRSRAHR